jgi:serine/threonine-protein kinase HipA
LRQKSNLKAADFIDYYAKERLQLNEKTIASTRTNEKSNWKELFEISLTDEMKEKYLSCWKVG